MGNILGRVWNEIKWPVFLIVWTAGIIGFCMIWFVGIPMWKEIRHQADQTWIEHLERQAIKQDGSGARVEESKQTDSDTQSLVPSREEKRSEKVADTGAETPPPGDVEKLIYEIFKEDAKLAVAIFRAESGLRPRAQGYNCFYGKYSRACRKGDEHLAWSTDCGIAQINVLGKVCPASLFNPKENLRVALQKYQTRRWQPWSAFRNKSYLKYL